MQSSDNIIFAYEWPQVAAVTTSRISGKEAVRIHLMGSTQRTKIEMGHWLVGLFVTNE